MTLSSKLNEELNSTFTYKTRKSQKITRRKTAIAKMLEA